MLHLWAFVDCSRVNYAESKASYTYEYFKYLKKLERKKKRIAHLLR
jgi:hypothetical protein